MSNFLVLTEENFEEETVQGAVVIDFYADWCGPCKMMAPTFDEAASEYEGRVKFAKVNVDDCKKVAVQNKVISIPTLLFLKDGEVKDRVSGVIDKDTLARKLNALL